MPLSCVLLSVFGSAVSERRLHSDSFTFCSFYLLRILLLFPFTLHCSWKETSFTKGGKEEKVSSGCLFVSRSVPLYHEEDRKSRSRTRRGGRLVWFSSCKSSISCFFQLEKKELQNRHFIAWFAEGFSQDADSEVSSSVHCRRGRTRTHAPQSPGVRTLGVRGRERGNERNSL